MTRILYFSMIIWILIDRIKKAWSEVKYASYITSAVALGLGILFSCFYHLDMLYELELTEEVSVIGEIMTGIALMGGSSCINEILNIRTKTVTEYLTISEEEEKDMEIDE